MKIIFAFKEKDIQVFKKKDEFGFETIELQTIQTFTATNIKPETFMKMCDFFYGCRDVVVELNSNTYIDIEEAIKVLVESRKQILSEKATTKDEIKERRQYLLSNLRRTEMLTNYLSMGYSHLTNRGFD